MHLKISQGQKNNPGAMFFLMIHSDSGTERGDRANVLRGFSVTIPNGGRNFETSKRSILDNEKFLRFSKLQPPPQRFSCHLAIDNVRVFVCDNDIFFPNRKDTLSTFGFV